MSLGEFPMSERTFIIIFFLVLMLSSVIPWLFIFALLMAAYHTQRTIP